MAARAASFKVLFIARTPSVIGFGISAANMI
jgi:hypothetical protein